MEKIKIHARILQTNVVGQTAFFQIQIRGLETTTKKIPHDFPVQTLASKEEFTIHFGAPNEMTEAEIAPLIPDRFITIDAQRDETQLIIDKIVPVHTDNDLTFAQRLGFLEKLNERA